MENVFNILEERGYIEQMTRNERTIWKRVNSILHWY